MEDLKQTDDQPETGAAGNFSNVFALVSCRFAEKITLKDLARAAGSPTNTLTRQFNRRYGMSPMRWLWSFRTILAAELIAASPQWPLAQTAKHCGFQSAAHFSRRFREIFGESPSTFRAAFRHRRGAGATALSPGARPSGTADLLARTFAKLEALASAGKQRERRF